MAIVNETRVDGGIAIVELNDPDRYNALSTSLVSELKSMLGALRDDRDVRVIVLRGAGKGFCAGANMTGGDMLPDTAQGRGSVGTIQMAQEHLAELMLAVREMRQPVIAAVHGGAVGGGLALALACDLRVADTTAFFAAHFIKVGLSSCDVGTSYLLPRIAGPTIALELMLTGRRFDAAEAHRIGVVNRIVDADVSGGAGVSAAAVELAAEIASNSEFGVYMTKIGMWANLDAPSLRHAMELENRTQVLGTFTGNMREAISAFTENRPASWEPM